MNYYLISPKVDGKTINGFIEKMFDQHIVMMGWSVDDSKIGENFNQLENGDFVIVAQRVNWKFNYFFAGIIDDDASYEDKKGFQCRKLRNFVDLRTATTDYLADASFAEMRAIKAMMAINHQKNSHVISILDTIIQKQMEQEQVDYYINLLIGNHNLILTGAPGTGKTYLAKQIAQQMIFGEVKENITEERKQFNEQCGFVQFHPSYDYTDFVEGLRPVNKDGQLVFERKDGSFMEFCRRALDSYNNALEKTNAPKYVFIIDEINRGEMSKIFGELFFSIDPGYRGVKGRVLTQYNNLIEEGDVFKNGFYVPENVYIIGTMNDIDRSVESMDFAFRRRFAFKEIGAEERTIMLDEKIPEQAEKAKERMKNLNLAIETIEGLSKAYHIGPAYFLKLKNYLNDKKPWDSLWNNHLEGLLREYLRGMPEAVENLKSLAKAYGYESDSNNGQ